MNWTPTAEQLYLLTGYKDIDRAPLTCVVHGLEDEKYRSACGVSQSFLRAMSPTPAHACSFFEKRDTQAFRVGRMVHHAILTPNNPLPELTCYPETYTDDKGEEKPWHRGAKACKRWEQDQILSGLTVLTRDEFREISGCVKSLAANQIAQKVFREGFSEVSLFQKMAIDGVEFIAKARVDWAPKEGSALFDVKTVRRGEGGMRDFSKSVKWDGYGFQAAFYLMLWNVCNPDNPRSEFAWAVVEKDAPYAVNFFYIDALTVSGFQRDVEDSLITFARSIEDGVFEGDNLNFQQITA